MSEPFVGERIILRAVTDPTFRAGLATNPEQTLREAGFQVTREQLNVITLARPAEWGNLSPEQIQVRIDTLAKKR